MPYRVDRSKLFVMDRVAKVKWLDATRIANAIECTRHGADDSDGEEGTLVRAANLIGQLGDPQYLRKANALYYEFEEVGRNKQFGYLSPADLTDLYPKFYWSSVSAHIQSAMRYLERHVERTAVDRQSPQQYLSRRARATPVRSRTLRPGVNSTAIELGGR